MSTTLPTAADAGRHGSADADPNADDALDGPGFATLSIASILAETAHHRPHSPAVHFAGTTVTYGELWDGARAYAGALRDLGIGRGDRVAMIVPNVPDFARIYYGVVALGAVVVPVHLLFTTEEIQYVLEDAAVSAVVVAAPLLETAAPAAAAAGIPLLSVLVPDEAAAALPFPRLEDAARATTPIERHVGVNPLDPATILYTSGTTGHPKGAVGSHIAIVEQVNVSVIDLFGMRADDVVFGGLPLFHTFGQTTVMNVTFRVGASMVLLPKFDADAALALMVETGVTVFTAVPTMYLALLQAADRTEARPPLRYAVSGGAALPVAVLERFVETFGAEVHEGYGLTETSPAITFNRVGVDPRPGTVGTPLWGVDVEIADAELPDRIALLPRGELGEIVVRGHALFKGYFHEPEKTAAAMVDGWFRTGDLGTKDDEDYIRVIDRTKDMIVRNGYNVYPSEVEGVMIRCRDVGSVAVFGVADEAHGQEVHAAVVPAPGSTLDTEALLAEVREHVAPYKFPRVVHVLDALPLGPSGKVLKRELVARFS